MNTRLKKLTLRGFKSIERLDDFELGDLTVLIGANGAGKSNFVDFFRLVRAMADKAFQKFVLEQGGGDGFFYLGPKFTPRISIRLELDEHNIYEFDLEPTADGSMVISNERIRYTNGTVYLRPGQRESDLHSLNVSAALFDDDPAVSSLVYKAISNWTVYHFQDTTMLAPMRRIQSARDRAYLRHDGSNLASYLKRLRDENIDTYTQIRDTVRFIAPYFDDFILEPEERGNEEKIRLEWRQTGSDFPFQPGQLSDGTIRFICLATALLQPDPPATMVIDEPELGLHPYAISLLAELIHSAAARTQVIISTQSPTLLDHFEPDQIVAVNRIKGQSTFSRLDAAELKEWLEEYTVGELWQKNVVRGGPTHD